jgi:hypothetical protein
VTARRGRVAVEYACRRCGRVIVRERQLCGKGTLASLFCWPPDDGDGSLEIQPGLLLRPGGGAEHPVMQPDDPYAE